MKPNPELRKRISEVFINYYSNPDIRKYITEAHRFKETGLIAVTNDKEFPKKKIRNLKLDLISSFDYTILNALRYFKEPYNVYHSCATYKNGLPIFFNNGMSKEEVNAKKEEWKNTRNDKITSFDYFLDIDSPSFETLPVIAQSTLEIYNFLKEYNENVKVIFSGCGFHLTIKDYIKGKPTLEEIETLRSDAKKINEMFSEFVDYGVVEYKRIKKTPNTLVYREGYKNIMLCKEVENIEELKNFKYKNYIYQKVKQ